MGWEVNGHVIILFIEQKVNLFTYHTELYWPCIRSSRLELFFKKAAASNFNKEMTLLQVFACEYWILGIFPG